MKTILCITLVLWSFSVYPQEESLPCVNRAFLYSNIAKMRDTDRYTMMDIIRGVSKYLKTRNIHYLEGKEILFETQLIVENKKIKPKEIFLKYLAVCGDTDS